MISFAGHFDVKEVSLFTKPCNQRTSGYATQWIQPTIVNQENTHQQLLRTEEDWIAEAIYRLFIEQILKTETFRPRNKLKGIHGYRFLYPFRDKTFLEQYTQPIHTELCVCNW